jgi:two-component system sensor histidine kinase KdpD
MTAGLEPAGGREGPRQRGRLTIYVGAAAGVGKTYRMLQDAHDLVARGVDVVVGLVETHGRRDTAAELGSLQVLPLTEIEYHGRLYPELDVGRILRRRPAVVLIDELAHSNVPGSAREKRYQDILHILSQGIDVMTAVNIQHLESLQDTVEHITGIRVKERVPDSFMDRADEIKLIDASTETLQERLQEGKIYSADKVDWALSHFFSAANLAALREVALLEVANDEDQRRDRALGSSARGHRESILVCVDYRRRHAEKLIRRGWRIADRLHAELHVLSVVPEEIPEEHEAGVRRVEELARQFGAQLIRRPLPSGGVGPAIVETAREIGISQLVIGQPREPKKGWLGRLEPTPVDYVLAHADFMDLHVVSTSNE